MELSGPFSGPYYPRLSHPLLDFQKIQLSPSSSQHGNLGGSQREDVAYIEASYQPPPPDQSRRRVQRDLPNLPQKNMNVKSSSAYSAPPPSYPSLPVPSSLTSFKPLSAPPYRPPLIRDLSSSTSSIQFPSLTELPNYSPSQNPYTHSQTSQRSLQLSSHVPRTEDTHLQRVPFGPVRLEIIPSLLRAPDPKARAFSAESNVSSNKDDRNQPVIVPTFTPLSPVLSTEASPLAEQAPKFVFPGGRSTSRPKASSKKISSHVIKTQTSQLRSSPHAPQPPLPKSRTKTTAHANSFPSSLGVKATRSESSSETAFDISIAAGSGSASPSGSSSTFVFPGGRSRAQPSKSSRSARKQSTKSPSNEDEINKPRPRFMGMLMKKKQKPEVHDSSNGPKFSSGSVPDSDIAPSRVNRDILIKCEEDQATIHQESRTKTQPFQSRIGSYPLDPYDSLLLDSDRQTGELLVRLNPSSSPTFYDYRNTPPISILDLGCGQGHWVVDAATAWKGYGTQVTGYDMVDIFKGVLPRAAEQGVMENIHFVRGNFLRENLPFGDESFDLVRMSCLALCITSDAWTSVLREVCRVLMVGGRLELIDDVVFFPYGTTPSQSALGASLNSRLDSRVDISVVPSLSITIPSASFSRLNIYNDEISTLTRDRDTEKFNFDPYAGMDNGFDEADVEDDTATLSESASDSGRSADYPSTLPSHRTIRDGDVGYSGMSPESWNRACSISRNTEALFEHMLVHKFGVNLKDAKSYLLDLMKDVFGHAREMRTMHLSLAPPPPAETRDLGRHPSRQARQSPGLVLWPSTLIPMDQSEIDAHASKHLRMLLSCIEHAIEVSGDDMDEESVLHALWEYESFLGDRFSPPPGSVSIPVDLNAEELSNARPITEATWGKSESEIRQQLSSTLTDAEDIASVNQTISSHSSNSSSPSNAAPLYSESRDDLTHIRTFRIYEAIKMGETLFGVAS